MQMSLIDPTTVQRAAGVAMLKLVDGTIKYPQFFAEVGGKSLKFPSLILVKKGKI